MVGNEELIAVDFDGTLFFTEKCMKLAAKDILKKNMTFKQILGLPREVKSGIYEVAFTKYNHHSILNRKMQKVLESKRNCTKIILTARHNGTDALVKGLLKKHKIKIDRIVSRKMSEMRLDDEDWKARTLNKMVPKYRRVEVYEDKLDNIEHIRSHVGHTNIEFYLVKSGSIRRVFG